MKLAIVGSDGRVLTFVRADAPDGFVPPPGTRVVPEDELPKGWEWSEKTSVDTEKNDAYLALDRLLERRAVLRSQQMAVMAQPEQDGENVASDRDVGAEVQDLTVLVLWMAKSHGM